MICNFIAEILLTLHTSRYHIYKTILIAKEQTYRNDSHRVYLSDENLIVSGDQESKPSGKGPLTGVKCKQRNARTSAILPVFSKSRESICLQIPAFLNLSESCQELGVLVQGHSASLFSKLR